MNDWKPGDVAMVTAANRPTPYRAYWDTDTDGRGLWREYGSPNSCLISCTSARPLAVVDPESRVDIERLRDLYDREVIVQNDDPDPRDVTPAARGNALQAALREYATPTPPKPDEPTGLGAVVEDAEGRRYVRTEPFDASSAHIAWYCPDNEGLDGYWSQIEAVRVLSEGVTP